jgi:ribosomal protein S18 acetylase RimI-like enzyme
MIRTQAWHLRFIGVEPQYQRQGLGRALVEAILRDVRAISSDFFLHLLTSLLPALPLSIPDDD